MHAETICQKRPLFRDTGQWLQLPEATLYDRHTFLHGHGLCGRPSPADHTERPIRRTSALRERAVSGTSEGPVPTADLVRSAVTERHIGTSPRMYAGAPPGVSIAPGSSPDPYASAETPPDPYAATDVPAGTPPDTPASDGASPRTFQAAFATAPLAMAVVDREGLVVTANESLGALLGPGADALAGRIAADLVDLASDARTWHSYREVLRGRRGPAALHPPPQASRRPLALGPDHRRAAAPAGAGGPAVRRRHQRPP